MVSFDRCPGALVGLIAETEIESAYDSLCRGAALLLSASTIGERYDHGYWLKEKIFREIRARIRQTPLEKELTRLYYTGQFEEYARRISEVPAK